MNISGKISRTVPSNEWHSVNAVFNVFLERKNISWPPNIYKGKCICAEIFESGFVFFFIGPTKASYIPTAKYIIALFMVIIKKYIYECWCNFLTGPKTAIDVQLSSIGALLIPKQVHFLSEIVDVFSKAGEWMLACSSSTFLPI